MYYNNINKPEENKYLRLFTDEFKQEYLKKPGKCKKIFAVMFFNTEFELGISANPYAWINTGNIVTLNGFEALEIYANTPNPASQILDAESIEELTDKMLEMNKNFKDEKWLEKLYETL